MNHVPSLRRALNRHSNRLHLLTVTAVFAAYVLIGFVATVAPGR
jgi:hypothetical protein